jgi:type I restriction enzyme S subunit
MSEVVLKPLVTADASPSPFGSVADGASHYVKKVDHANNTMFDTAELRLLVERHLGGGTPPRLVATYWKGDIPWASVKDFAEDQTEITITQESISPAGLYASASNLIPEGIPLVCTRMAVGRAALPTVPMAINQDVKALFPATDVDPRHLLRLLHYVRPKAEAASVGSTVRGIRIQDYLSIAVPKAPSDEQPIIARVLDALDTAIRQTEAIIAKLKQVKQGLLHDLLTRGIDANGELRPSRSHAPQLYKQSPVGWIPKDWRLRPLGEVAEVARGKFTHRPRNDPAFLGGRHPFIQTGDVASAAGDYLSTYSQTLSDRGAMVSQEFPAGTIAITIAANIADTAILDRPMYFPDSVVGAVVAPVANIRFIELCIRRAKRGLDARAPQSAQKNINLQDLRPLLVAFPTRNEQDAIAAQYDVIQARLTAEDSTKTKLTRQKIGLMDDLLIGRVRVTALLNSTTAL